ncbi:MAG: TonB-dependent receptor [Bacteroidaceae bacterium]|nr:TonB-dependent receptor [Bacteroidaceae bacterium]MBR1682930.1 TonB-dependent receptor [Bacteroidaceae bacterium]
MTNRVKLATMAWCLASAMFAQQPQGTATPKTPVDDDNADFTFTESQLDEGDEATTVSSLVATKTDPYLSRVGFLFSPMRFRVRGLDNQYNQTYLNGIMYNDAERGRFSYSMIGGLNQIVNPNREGASAFENTVFGLPGIGGATSINLRPGSQRQGNQLTLSGCNRNYVARAAYSFASGFNAKGWAFSGAVGYRWSKEGNIEGTFYNSLSYYLGVEKKLGDRHSFSLITFGAPTERGQQGASTEEAYWLANSHYYNPNWGYQDGKKRNSRVVRDYEPTAILTWDFDIDQYTKLTTAAGFRYSMYSGTALGWNGNAADPRPDYYKNFPSSIFNVYDDELNNEGYLGQNKYFLDQWQTLYDYWTADKANRQVQWDRMYAVNRAEAARNGETLYYQERRHNDQLMLNLSSTLNRTIDQSNKYSLGLQFNSTKGMHYKTMADLLGGVTYYDYDKFAANEYGKSSIEAENDLRNPHRLIGVGDKFGYDYNIHVHKARLWGQYLFHRGMWDFSMAAHVDGTVFERDGLMQNGRAPENSYGSSGWAKFLHGGGRARLAFDPTPNHRISLSGSWDSEAPMPANSFVAPRIQNNYINNLDLEDIFNAELAYDFRFGIFSGRIAGYYTYFNNGVEQTAFYNDDQSRFTYLTMNGIQRVHYGLEAAFNLQITNSLSVHVLGTISEAKYDNNPLAQLAYEGSDATTIAKVNRWVNPVTKRTSKDPLCVYAEGMHMNGTPLTALNIGVNYNIKGWYLGLDLNYYDRVYLGFSQYRRLSNVMAQYVASGVDEKGRHLFPDVDAETLKNEGGILYDQQGNIIHAYSAKQEKFDGGFMLDASIGHSFYLRHGRSLNVNLSLSNLLNNTNMRTSGYEQNRDDNYYNLDGSVGESKAYKFSKNPKYYYAQGFNFFLNIGFRF